MIHCSLKSWFSTAIIRAYLRSVVATLMSHKAWFRCTAWTVKLVSNRHHTLTWWKTINTEIIFWNVAYLTHVHIFLVTIYYTTYLKLPNKRRLGNKRVEKRIISKVDWKHLWNSLLILIHLCFIETFIANSSLQ